MDLKRLPMVPVLSSAARMPLPEVAIAFYTPVPTPHDQTSVLPGDPSGGITGVGPFSVTGRVRTAVAISSSLYLSMPEVAMMGVG